MERLKRRLVVMVCVALIALLGWKLAQSMGWIEPPAAKCVPERLEEKDASGKVIKITTRTCYS